MQKTKIKQADHAAQVTNDEKHRNRLNSLKNELEAGRISRFDQIFAIVSETRLAIEMGISFYAFRKKVLDPGEFKLNEVVKFSALFGVKYDVMADWLKERIKAKSKSKVFK